MAVKYVIALLPYIQALQIRVMHKKILKKNGMN